jgi:hypothetical protein
VEEVSSGTETVTVEGDRGGLEIDELVGGVVAESTDMSVTDTKTSETTVEGGSVTVVSVQATQHSPVLPECWDMHDSYVETSAGPSTTVQSHETPDVRRRVARKRRFGVIL